MNVPYYDMDLRRIRTARVVLKAPHAQNLDMYPAAFFVVTRFSFTMFIIFLAKLLDIRP
jgi:hypothetical protein